MRGKVVLLSIGLAMLASPAMAQTMNAEVFHRRATKLQNKGPAAIFSMGEIKALVREVQEAGKRNREARLAAAAAGRKPRYCPPANAKGIDDKEFMARLSAIPAAERARIDMTEATARIMAGKHPCPAT